MASITKDTTNHVWVFTDTLTNNSYNVVFDTLNKFLDAKIKASLTVQSGTISPIFTNTNLSTYFDEGTSSSNSISIVPKATNTGGFIAEHDSNSPVTGTAAYYTIKSGAGAANSANVVLYTTDGTNAGENISSIVGTAVDTEPNTAGTYYLAFTGSGSSKISTTGWMTSGTTLTAASKTRYFPITKAVATATKTSGTITPTASLSQSNVTFSNSNTSGVSVTATGNGSVSNLAIAANITTAGYAPAGNNFATASGLSIAAASTAATETQYITGVTIGSGKSFAVTNSGTTTVTSGSTSAGKITIVAKNAAGDSSNTTKDVVVNGLWNPQKMAAANTSYYGRVYADALTVTTSADTGNLSTYFNSGSSSDNNVTITPKYTNTAGFKTVLSTATNSGGITYWKIKTTSVTQNNTTVTATDSSNHPTTVTRGTATWGTGWITSSSIDAATFANTASANTTYIDISYTTDAPVLISGDYLYINKGYVDNLKISLAKLIPDSITGYTMASASYILSGYAAFDGSGNAITGNIATYNGAYTVT